MMHFICVQKFRAVDLKAASIERYPINYYDGSVRSCHSCGTILGPAGNCPSPACVRYRRQNAGERAADMQSLKPDWAVQQKDWPPTPRDSETHSNTSQADSSVKNGQHSNYYLDEVPHPSICLSMSTGPVST